MAIENGAGRKGQGARDEVVGWLSSRLYRDVDQEKIALARNMCLGSAGLALLAIFRLSMAAELTVALAVALYAFVIAIPLFVALAFWYEAFIWLGPSSYAHLDSCHVATGRVTALAMLALTVGVVAITWHLSPAAALLLVAVAVAALVLLERNFTTLQRLLDTAESGE